ncbi:MAG: flagellar export chaperone FliS [Sterolibacteriaceae bacterium]|uniref:Flagellar secretion chaperone FliS n=1 Tax=Candidatus Methylophosphatis roskildensis TaxID=2899263 RepID=A0A9D7DXE8_9PROT|nr:flagellar export chaperone FliS [Candidatus Methylophosphatis roskildensis]
MFAHRSGALAYKNVGVENGVSSADPHRLTLMLFEGALVSTNAARIHLESGDVPLKGSAISKAIEIISNGLKVSLDFEVGGELAQRLASLYDYMCTRLLHANVRNDLAALAEVSTLLRELKEAWEQIGKPNSIANSGSTA